MEAKRVDKIPTGDTWQFEPKWDGFRAIVFRDGDEVSVQSKAGQPLARYFPEIVEALEAEAKMRAALIFCERMNLVHDDPAHRGEMRQPLLLAEQQRKAFGSRE